MLALINGHYAMWRECVGAVQSCDIDRFDDFYRDPQLEDARTTIGEWRASYYEIANPEALTFEVLEVHLDFTIPYVLICERDGGTLVERRPGEPERVIEQGYVEAIREVQLQQVSGAWRIMGYHTRESVEGQVGALCS